MKSKTTKKFMASVLSALMCLTCITSGSLAATIDETDGETYITLDVVEDESSHTCAENTHLEEICIAGHTASISSTCLHQERTTRYIGRCPDCNGFLYAFYCKSCGKLIGRFCNCGVEWFD